MKDILIKGSRIKKELVYWTGSFIAAVIINIYSIIKYNTGWSEVISQLHIVFLLSLFTYILLITIRGLIHIIKLWFSKSSGSK